MWAAWLSLPIVGTLLAIAWNSWRSRAPRPEDPAAGVAAYERFRASMAQPLPPPHRGRRRRR